MLPLPMAATKMKSEKRRLYHIAGMGGVGAFVAGQPSRWSRRTSPMRSACERGMCSTTTAALAKSPYSWLAVLPRQVG